MFIEKTEKSLAYLRADTVLAESIINDSEADEELKERATLEKEVIEHAIDALEALKIIITDPIIKMTIEDLLAGKSINWHRLPEEQREFLKTFLSLPRELLN